MRKLLIITILLSVILTGCSKESLDKQVTVKWDNGQYTVNGKDVGMKEYSGYSASREDEALEAFFNYSIIFAEDLTTAEGNSAMISSGDMDHYKNKAYCFSRYLGTYAAMYYPIGDNYYYYGTAACNNTTVEQLYLWLWNDINNLILTNAGMSVEFGNSFVMNGNGSTVKVTEQGASITGTIKVTKSFKSECNEPFTITQGEQVFNMTMYSTNQYSYYQYGDYLIQTILGLNVAEFIEFK